MKEKSALSDINPFFSSLPFFFSCFVLVPWFLLSAAANSERS